MSRKYRRDRARTEHRHVRLYHWLMNTLAWKSLDATARAVYIEMARRYAGQGSNNGRIHYSVREAADALRIGKSTAARALNDLVDRGFVVVMKKGGFNVKKRHATEWRLTEFPCDVSNQLSTKEFARWPEKNQTAGPVGGLVGIYRRTGQSL
jgi:hypothetical protein